MATNYRRTPLPDGTAMPLGWLALWLMLLIFSPFVGFAIHGKVGEPGLETGLAIAPVPLLALAWLALRRWRHLRRVPAHLLEEWRSGRIVHAEGAPAVAGPVRFAHKKDWIELRSEGVTLSRHSLLGMPDVERRQDMSWVAQQSGQLFLPWHQISEWAVDTDSDGPDYHCLKLRAQGEVKVQRFHPDAATECDLLDAVRSVGRLPIRLRCDVACAGT